MQSYIFENKKLHGFNPQYKLMKKATWIKKKITWINLIHVLKLSSESKGPFGYNWKLKTETEKHCSKIFLNVWIVSCDSFLMKKLLKNEIDRSMNNKICAEKCEKVKLCGRNNKWTVTKFGLKHVKKKNAETQTRVSVSTQSKHSLSIRVRRC